MRITGSTLIVALATLVAACSNDPPAAVSVAATADLRFAPSEATVAVGGQVTWEFAEVPHNVFFTSGSQAPADIPELTSNATVSRTFASAGTYDYECRVHPGMTGRVIVKGGSAGLY